MNAPQAKINEKAIRLAREWYQYKFQGKRFTGTDSDFEELGALLDSCFRKGAAQMKINYFFHAGEALGTIASPEFNIQFISVETLPSEEKK